MKKGKKIVFLFAAMIGAASVNAASVKEAESSEAAQPVDSLKTVELQGVQVRSLRASKKTPMAFTDMDKDQIKKVTWTKIRLRR